MTPKAPAPATTDEEKADAVGVSFDRAQGGYRVQIQTRGANAGSRELADDNTTCSSLAQATALTIALILDPNATPPPAPAPPPPPPPREEAKREEPGTPWGVVGVVGGGIGAGIVRSIVPFVEVALSLRPRSWLAVSLGGVLVPTQSLPLTPGTVDVALTGGRAELCVIPMAGRVRLGACGGSLVGVLSAAGRGYPTEVTAHRPLVGGTLGLVGEGEVVGPLGWVAHLDGFAPIHRESFGISRAGVAYEEPSVGGFVSIGASMKFR
jgi:hypothetical protein